ncbi:MAG: hypothetical protein QW175_02830 [Candidatus Bathyarchaeia archaeon]
MPKSGVKCELEAVVRDKDGKVLEVVKKSPDLILANFRKIILWGVLGAANSTDNQILVSVKDENGNNRNLAVWWTGERKFTYTPGPNRLKIVVGTGSTPPTRDDYCLANKVAETTSVSVLQGEDYVAYSAAIALPNETTITEAGFLNQYSTEPPGSAWIMLLRDVFTSVNVPAGGSIGITYKITI